MISRQLAFVEDDDSKAREWYTDSAEFLNRARNTVMEYAEQSDSEIEQKIFMADYLVENARFKAAFVGWDDITKEDAKQAMRDSDNFIRDHHYERFSNKFLSGNLQMIRSIHHA